MARASVTARPLLRDIDRGVPRGKQGRGADLSPASLPVVCRANGGTARARRRRVDRADLGDRPARASVGRFGRGRPPYPGFARLVHCCRGPRRSRQHLQRIGHCPAPSTRPRPSCAPGALPARRAGRGRRISMIACRPQAKVRRIASGHLPQAGPAKIYSPTVAKQPQISKPETASGSASTGRRVPQPGGRPNSGSALRWLILARTSGSRSIDTKDLGRVADVTRAFFGSNGEPEANRPRSAPKNSSPHPVAARDPNTALSA
jgi:hypothetical protein